MEKEEQFLLEKLKIASELHRHEDSTVWEKFYHFLTLNGILISGLGIMQSTLLSASTDKIKIIIASIGISSFGFFSSLIFCFVFKKSKKYQNHRVKQSQDAEKSLLVGGKQIINVYSEKLGKLSFWTRFSTYDLLFLMSFLTMITWLSLIIIFIIIK